MPKEGWPVRDETVIETVLATVAFAILLADLFVGLFYVYPAFD